jgi:hypothetical protein
MANKKTEIQTVKAETTNTVAKVTVNDAIVVNVTSPSTIDRIAKEKNINPQEVFVRCTFQYNGMQFTASNKLRFLTKAGYTELLEAKEKKTPMKFVVDVEKEFFYIEHDVAVDSLFETPVATEDKRTKLTALLNV